MRSFIAGFAVGIISAIVGFNTFTSQAESKNDFHEKITDAKKIDLNESSFFTENRNIISSSSHINPDNQPTATANQTRNAQEDIQCNLETLNAIRHIDSISRKDPVELNTELTTEFYLEAIDDTWAPTYQQQLEELIRSNDQLRNYLPETIECRTSKCLMRIKYYSNEDRNKLSDDLIDAIGNNASGIHPEVVISPIEDTQTLEIILNRKS